MIPYSRPKLSDLNTLSQSKLLENHTLQRGQTYSHPLPPRPPAGYLHNMPNYNAQVY